MVKVFTRLFTIIVAVFSMATVAAAQEDNAVSSSLPAGLDLAVGAGVGYAPEYLGADDYQAVFLPTITMDYQDLLFLSIHNQPYSGDDEAGMYLVNDDNLKAGFSVTYLQGRDENDNGHLTGLGDIDWTFNGGGFVTYEYKDFYGTVKLHHDLLNEHEGFLGKFELGYNYLFNRQLKGILSVSADYGSEDFMDTYFGINAAQAGASGLAQYDADGGLYRSALTGTVIYKVTPGLFVQGTAEYGHLMDEAADSPVVRSNNQFFVGTTIGYMF